MSKPVRIQRKRTKGWKMPPNTVYVGRPNKFGNPFDHRQVGRKRAVSLFRRWITNRLTVQWLIDNGATELEAIQVKMTGQMLRKKAVDELRGKNLACWCSLDQPCHADVLLELANED